MADFTKLNGYDVKDSQARSDIIDISNKIGELNDLTTTDTSSIVGAIYEVNGNVGDLTDLTTTEKSSVVGAINEVKGDIPTNVSDLNNNLDFVRAITMTVATMDDFKAYCVNTASNGITFYNLWLEGGAEGAVLLQKTSSNYLSYIYFNYTGDVYHNKYYEGTWTSNNLG